MSVASTQQEPQRAQERTQHGPGRVNLTPDAGYLVLDAVEAPLDAVESSVDSAELSVGLGAQLVDPLVEARADRGAAPPTPPLQQALAAYLRELARRIDAQSPPLPSWLLRRIANTVAQESHVVARFDAHHKPTGSLHVVGGQKGQSK